MNDSHANSTPEDSARPREPRDWILLAGNWLRLGCGGVLLAAAALVALVTARSPGRLVNVTPLLGRTDYEIHAFRDGRSLTSREVAARYATPFHGLSPLTPKGLKAIVRAREGGTREETETYVRVHLRVAGQEEEIWLWPEH